MSENNKKFKFAYPGSFDPWTRGHLSVITSFLSRDPDANIEIIIGDNPEKDESVFSALDRKFIIIKSIPRQYRVRVKISIVSGVVANYMYKQDIPYFIKGVRDATDYYYESNLARLNSQLPGSPMTLLIPQTESQLSTVSSSNLKMLANLGIRLDIYATGFVREALKLKTSKKMFIGVVGGIASGKSTFCEKISKYAKDKDLTIHHINMDSLGHIILAEKENVLPLYNEIRYQVLDLFGDEIKNPDGTINRKILGDIVFHDKRKLDALTNIMHEPILFLMGEKINSLGPGIVLIESAILLERNLSELVDDNIIHISVPKETQIERMIESRGLSMEQAERRIDSQQISADIKTQIKNIQRYNFNRLNLEIDSSKEYETKTIYNMLEKEYFFRLNTRRYNNIFIPSNLSFKDEREYVLMLKRQYNTPKRYYHNLTHVRDLLCEYEKIKSMLKNPLEVYFAIIFHDIIYDFDSNTNEKDSADFAIKYLKENLLSPTKIDYDIIHKLITLTSSHDTNHLKKDKLTNDEKLFLDMDLGTLASCTERLLEYEEGIKKEFISIFPENEYKKQRLDFLNKILSREIYLSDYYSERSEISSKENIKFLIEKLSK